MVLSMVKVVVPVGGGIPMSKYYFTPLHFRMRFADLLTIYNRLGWGQRGARTLVKRFVGVNYVK